MSDSALTVIRKDIAGIKTRFEAVSVDKSIVFEREASFAVQALMANDYAMKIAVDNRQSVINAVTNVSAIGISLNPARKQAYLVPRDGRICLDISYMGLLDIAIQSGAIRWGQAELVYEKDEFMLNDTDKLPTHKRNPFSKDRGELVGVYVVVKTADADYLTTCMSIDEVFAIRDRSAAWKAWIAKKARCPWVTDEGEMIKKTVIKRAYKMWPKTERLDSAVHYLNTEGGEGLEFDHHSSSGKIRATTGALNNIDADQLEKVRELANRVRAGYANLGPEASAEYIAEADLSAEEMIALWSLFDTESEMRTALKKAQAAMRFAA